ncbi:MAG: hypothetical protein M1122_00195 [Candidatus Marsarchaeota archaeon]|nr:hypothetical protein [Candidatus Marsarchaeota archaeon]
MADIEKAALKLQKSNKIDDWESFSEELKKSNVKYYRVFYKGLNKSDDLKRSYVELYDIKNKPITRVPLSVIEKNDIRGALIYLKGLRSVNLVSK